MSPTHMLHVGPSPVGRAVPVGRLTDLASRGPCPHAGEGAAVAAPS